MSVQSLCVKSGKILIWNYKASFFIINVHEAMVIYSTFRYLGWKHKVTEKCIVHKENIRIELLPGSRC
jgi:hypothetical protein